MKKNEVVDKLCSVQIVRHSSNAEVFDAFVALMRRYQYGTSETAQAWHFFVEGWQHAAQGE